MKNGNLSVAIIFAIIQHVVSAVCNYKNIIWHLCEAAGVSRFGYYNYLKLVKIRNRMEEKDLILKDIFLKHLTIEDIERFY